MKSLLSFNKNKTKKNRCHNFAISATHMRQLEFTANQQELEKNTGTYAYYRGKGSRSERPVDWKPHRCSSHNPRQWRWRSLELWLCPESGCWCSGNWTAYKLKEQSQNQLHGCEEEWPLTSTEVAKRRLHTFSVCVGHLEKEISIWFSVQEAKDEGAVGWYLLLGRISWLNQHAHFNC